MPPRRSTRSSVEPNPTPEPTTSKRKRSVVPSSSSSSSLHKARGKKSLDSLPEEDDEEEAVDEEEEEEEEEEVNKGKGKGRPVRKKARPSIEEEPAPQPTRARSTRAAAFGSSSRAVSAKPASSSLSAKPSSSVAKPPARGARGAVKKPVIKPPPPPSDDDDDEEEDDSEDEVLQEIAHVQPSRRASRRKSDPEEDEDEEMDEDEEEQEEKPTRRGSTRSRSSAAPARRSSATKEEKVVDIDIDEVESDEEEEEEPVPKKTRGKGRAPVSDDDDKEEEDEDEEEDEPQPTRRTTRTKTPASTRVSSSKPASSSKSKPASSSSSSKPTSSKHTSSAKPSSSRKTPFKPISSSKGKGKAKASLPIVSEDASSEDASSVKDDADEEEVNSTPTPTLRTRTPSTAHTSPSDDEEDVPSDTEQSPFNKEESPEPTSFLDPAPPASKKLLAPMPPLLLTERDEGPQWRLVIHKMALVDFKSYAGRQEIGPFHKSFSAIVGPNGSGKSNTIDALLFVFGYRATKMRQAKLSELIHNSARFKDLDSCSVEVHFREIMDIPDTDQYKIRPNSALVVARHAYKSEASKYTVDGKTSSYADVRTLLKGKGIDLDHNRFLILQGEVESIAQMKPKGTDTDPEGLLEYLEDIIGTNRFIEPLNEAQAKIDTLNDERTIKLNRLRYVEKEKAKLEEEKKAAEAYIKLCNEHARARSKLYQWNLYRDFEVQKKLERELTQWQTRLEEEREQNKDDVKHLEELEKGFQEKQALYETVQATADALYKEIAGMTKNEVTLQERQKHVRTKLKKEKKKLGEDENAKSAAEQSFESNTTKIERQQGEIEQHEANLVIEEGALEKIRDSLREKTQPFHLKIEQKQKELQPWTAQITVKQSEINNATSEREALAKRAEQVKESCAAAEEELANLEEHLSSKVVERDQLKMKRTKLQGEGQEASAALKDAQDRAQVLRQKASTARGKIEEARASQAANHSNNRVLNTLNALQSQGRVNGFHGRLGSLGTIPEQYDVAITTACGSLDNMVVDQVEQAQACIEYLRSQNAGRASFMILAKLPRNDIGMNPMQTPLPRLFDLIKPKDPRFAAAFYKAIGNTLVASNLDEANRIAFGPQAGGKRWRVVTLAGQLIDSSGTMSGGGGAPRRGGMSAKLQAESVSPQVMSSLEKDNGDASRMLDEALVQVRQAEAELERVKADEPRVTMDLSKLEMGIKGGQARVADVQKRVNELRAQSKPDAGDVARIKSLDKAIASATTELENLESNSASISAAIKEYEAKILEIGGSRLLAQKSKVDGLRTYINIATEEITKAEVAVAKAEKDVAKLTGSIKTGKVTVEVLQEEDEEVTGKLEQVQGEMAAIRVKVGEAKEAVENQKEDLDVYKEQLDEKTEEVKVFKDKEAGILTNLKGSEKKMADNEKSITEWQQKHDKLKLQDVDDDDDEDDDESPDASKDTSKEDEDAMDEDEAADDPDAEQKVKDEEDEDVASPSPKPTGSSDRGFYTYGPNELKGVNERELKIQVEVLDERVTKGAGANLAVINEYRKRNEDYLRRAEELTKITDERDQQKGMHEALRRQRVDEFLSGFHMISLKLKELYQMITMGGNAELELVDTMDPFSEGINFAVMPPKKSWKAISNLSGGEKTLSSLALVFALHVFKPTPLYFMDEIDAALDFRNVSIVANYIKDRTKNAQFIIISLRNDMFELSQRLVGIYKTNNATHSITIDNSSLVQFANASANGNASANASPTRNRNGNASPNKNGNGDEEERGRANAGRRGQNVSMSTASGSVAQGVRG